MQRLADDNDAALAVRCNEDDVAGVRFVTLRGVDVRCRRAHLLGHKGAGIVTAEGRKQMEFGGTASELEEGNATAASPYGSRFVQVQDLARPGQRRYGRDRHVFDVSDDGNAGRCPLLVQRRTSATS